MNDPRTAFIEAATWHGSLEAAEVILAANPAIAASDIHTAAILGDAAAVRRFLEDNPGDATATSAPYGGDALVHLCLSKYLRLDPARTDGFLRAATALLDAGANPNTGFWNKGEFETALYGAAGVAHHPALTQLLLDRGADPNDEEVVYHSPETDDNAVIECLVGTGKITGENLSLMLVRKHDWHDYDGVKYLLAHGADPNQRSRGRFPSALHHAIARDNDLEIIDLLLDYHADPTRVGDGRSAVALAARRGRGDVLQSFERRGIPIALQGVDRLIAACAMNNEATVRSIAEREPGLVRQLVAEGGTLLAQFAGTANTEGVRHLLDLGVDVAALYAEGDGYYGIAKDSTALHVAAWRAWHPTVRFLIERGAPIDALDGKGRTPLALAVRACVDSYWAYRRSPESVDVLLRAGASVTGVLFPSGYAAVDDLLRRHGATS
jgi:ankyrin repeat protein